MQRIPGVERAATGMVPLAKSVSTAVTSESAAQPVRVFADATSPDYFSALRIPLLAGRMFDASDVAASPRVAIVSRKTAARLWPGSPGNAVGRRISMSSRGGVTVVGIVGDVRGQGLEKDVVLDVYFPDLQTDWLGSNNLMVRVNGDPRSVLPGIRSAVRSIDPTQAVSRIATLDERISSLIAPRRFNLFVLGVFSVLAFLLAAVGVYGVVSQTVAMRTREIGIRVALGANRPDVLRTVAQQGVSLVIAGDAIGLLVALALNRVMQTMVFGVTTTDATTYATVTIAWAAVAVLACYVPARRATTIDPIAALRCE